MSFNRLWRRSNQSLFRAACHNPGENRQLGPTPFQVRLEADRGIDSLIVDDLLLEELIDCQPHANLYLVRSLPTGRMLRMREFASELRLTADAYRSIAKRSLNIKRENVVQPFRIFESMGRLYVVSECVDGESLNELVHRLGPLTPDISVQLAIDLLACLQSLRTTELAGLRPQQVIVTADKNLRCIDLDESDLLLFMRKRRLASTQNSVLSGADRAFFAPEVLSGIQSHSEGHLIFSVGRILSFLATADWRSNVSQKLNSTLGWRGLVPLLEKLQSPEQTHRIASFDEAIRVLRLAIQEPVGLNVEPQPTFLATDLAKRPAIAMVSYAKLTLTLVAMLLIAYALVAVSTNSITNEVRSSSEVDATADPVKVLSDDEFFVP